MTLDEIRALNDKELIDLFVNTAVIGMRFVTYHYPPTSRIALIKEEKRLKRLIKNYLMTYAR